MYKLYFHEKTLTTNLVQESKSVRLEYLSYVYNAQISKIKKKFFEICIWNCCEIKIIKFSKKKLQMTLFKTTSREFSFQIPVYKHTFANVFKRVRCRIKSLIFICFYFLVSTSLNAVHLMERLINFIFQIFDFNDI